MKKQEMYLVLQKALPEVNELQMESIIDSLLENGLTVERLRHAALVKNGGCQLVASCISRAHLGLNQGQTLAIATCFDYSNSIYHSGYVREN